MTNANNFSSSPACSTTVILFCVNVPVLSEQIICVQPSVSTAVNFRIMAFLLDILVTPILKTMVTTAANPSGIAATAKLTAIIKVDKMESILMVSTRIKSITKITIQIPKTKKLKILLN